MRQFFTEANDRLSMTRLCTFLLIISGIAITAVAVFMEIEGAHYGIELIVLGLTGKVTQKFLESKPKKDESAATV